MHIDVADGYATASIFGQAPRAGRVFDRDFVISALAFFCSRLLGPSKLDRAATVIQRAYRQLLLRRRRHQGWILSKLAHDCQTVVMTRTKVIGAASVIQRAWRLYWARKLDKIAAFVFIAGDDGDDNDDEPVTMSRTRTPGTVVRNGMDVKELETAEVDIWLL